MQVFTSLNSSHLSTFCLKYVFPWLPLTLILKCKLYFCEDLKDHCGQGFKKNYKIPNGGKFCIILVTRMVNTQKSMYR